MWQDHPVLGVGFERSNTDFEPYLAGGAQREFPDQPRQGVPGPWRPLGRAELLAPAARRHRRRRVRCSASPTFAHAASWIALTTGRGERVVPRRSSPRGLDPRRGRRAGTRRASSRASRSTRSPGSGSALARRRARRSRRDARARHRRRRLHRLEPRARAARARRRGARARQLLDRQPREPRRASRSRSSRASSAATSASTTPCAASRSSSTSARSARCRGRCRIRSPRAR